MKRLTNKQRQRFESALLWVRSIAAVWARECVERHGPEAKPSKRVSCQTLYERKHMTWHLCQDLIARGFLTSSPGNGLGEHVELTELALKAFPILKD